VFVDSIAVTVPVKFLSNEQNYLILISYTGKKKSLSLYFIFTTTFIYLLFVYLFIFNKENHTLPNLPKTLWEFVHLK